MIKKILKRARWIVGIFQKKGIIEGFKKLQNELYSSDIWHVFYLEQYNAQVSIIDDPSITVTRVAAGDSVSCDAIAKKWPSDFGVWKAQALHQMIISRSESMPCYVIKDNQKIVGALWFDKQDNVLEALGEKLKENQAVVRNIFIDTEYRGKGYSKLLLSEAMADIYQQGVDQFYAVAYPHKIGTERMCLSLGYTFTLKLKEKRRLFGHSVSKIES